MIKRTAAVIAALALAALLLLPFFVMATHALMTPEQLYAESAPEGVFTGSYGRGMNILPLPVSLSQFWDILAYRFEYLFMYWDSLKISVIITAGHLFVSLAIGYALGRYGFRGSKACFALYVAVLMLPFSVTLLPNYLLIKWLGLYDTQWAVMLPAIFSPLGALLMAFYIRSLPAELFDAASLETNSLLVLWTRILAPMVKPGIIALGILTFSEAWNMVEQPQVLMESRMIQPLSIALNGLFGKYSPSQFAGALLYATPVFFLCLIYRDTIMKELTDQETGNGNEASGGCTSLRAFSSRCCWGLPSA